MCGLTSVSIDTLDIGGKAFALLQGLKPEVELGSKTAVSSSATAGAWKIDVMAGEHPDEDLIDDDELLTEEDRKPVVPKTGDVQYISLLSLEPWCVAAAGVVHLRIVCALC